MKQKEEIGWGEERGGPGTGESGAGKMAVIPRKLEDLEGSRGTYIRGDLVGVRKRVIRGNTKKSFSSM